MNRLPLNVPLSYLPALGTALACLLYLGALYLFNLGLNKISSIPDFNIDKPVTSSTFNKPKLVKVKKIRK